MANQLTGNPLVFDSAGTKSGFLMVRQIQWIDDNQDIADGDSLVLTMNGVTLTFVVQLAAAPDMDSVVVWQVGPFNPPVKIQDFTVTTLAHGAVHCWLL